MSDRNQETDLRLLTRSRNSDSAAQEELIRKYTPMVRYIVRNNYVSCVEFEDMFQEGLIGLLSAIEEYNARDYDVKFSSFAYLCILRRIYNVVRQNNNYKNRTLNYAISLQTHVDDEQSRTLLDYLASDMIDPEETVENKWVAEHIDQVLRNHLSILEYTVIGLVLKGYTAAEIETKIGIDAKSVDNARTRVRFKLQRILSKYGSFTSPYVPVKVRKRKDLYVSYLVPQEIGVCSER